MVEVTRQLGPLAEQVGKLSNNVERLYNTNGGPPGYLQTARAEDNRRFEMIFKILEEHKEAIDPIKEAITANAGKEAQRRQDDKKLEKKFNTRLVIFGLVLSVISILAGNLQGCKRVANALTTSEVNTQNATIPQTR